MSWDIFVQDLPAGATTAHDIRDDFEPKPLMSRASLINGIKEIIPQADLSDPTWITVEGPGYSVEISIGADDPVSGFAVHVRGGDRAVGLVAELLEHFGLRALDPDSETGLFDRDKAVESLRQWRAYRDHVIGDRPQAP